jgi:hypothetical protein
MQNKQKLRVSFIACLNYVLVVLFLKSLMSEALFSSNKHTMHIQPEEPDPYPQPNPEPEPEPEPEPGPKPGPNPKPEGKID